MCLYRHIIDIYAVLCLYRNSKRCFKIHRQHIGQKLKASRKDKNISQTEAGRLIGVSHAVISKIECGKYTGSLKIYEKYISSMGYYLSIESERPQMPEFESLSELFADE